MIHQSAAPGQQQQQPTQMLSGSTIRFVRPTSVEQYEQLIPRQQPAFHPRAAEQQMTPRLPISQINIQRPPISQTPATSTASSGETSTNEQEIPDNVTAELEKLEQETGTMAELQGDDILGGLGDDDDDILLGNCHEVKPYKI